MIRYLWQKRLRPPIGTNAYFKAWAKRVLTAPTLISFAFRRWHLARRGASVDPDACIGPGNYAGRLINLRVGRSSFIGRVEMMLHGRVDIGMNVCINDGVVILTASHDILDPAWRGVVKDISIEDYAWIATGATILPGVRIGRGAVVGASAVVTKSVPDYGVVAGNPAVLLSKERSHVLAYSPIRFLAFQEAWLGTPAPH